MSYNGTLHIHYPDGTKGPPPPVDGYTFVTRVGDRWTWDAQLYKWVRGYGGDHTTHKPGDCADFSKVVLDNLENLSLPVCECGKEKHNFASHATWCQLWPTEGR
jgi:hypothetical protein